MNIILSRIFNCSFTKEQNWQEQDFIVLDMETSGFDTKKDAILSIGYVWIRQGKIDLSSANYMEIKPDAEREKYLKEKAFNSDIHHITPSMLTNALDINYALKKIFNEINNQIVVVHGAFIEKGFLSDYAKRHNLQNYMPALWIDTQAIYNKILKDPLSNQDLRLSTIRKKYNLPNYIAHHALCDAVATAELFIVLMKKTVGYNGSLKQISRHNYI
jgi:DNA polymerase III subunit epsilon